MTGNMEYTVWKSSLNHLSGTDDLLITYAKPQEKNTCNFAEISIFCFSKINAIKQYYYSISWAKAFSSTHHLQSCYFKM